MSAQAAIDAWLDGTADDAGQADLERRLADPAVADELIRTAHFRHAVRRAAAKAPSAAPRTHPRPRLRRPPAVRRLPRWWLAAAACLCAAAGIWLLVAQRTAADDRPTLAGRTLAGGDVVAAVEAPLTLHWRDGTRADLAAGASLRVEPGPGKRLALLRGSLQATVAKQQADAPMRLLGADCEAVVLGTVLEFAQGAAATRLAVRRGAVRLVRDRDGFDATIGEGGSCLLPFHGRPAIEHQDPGLTVLDDDGLDAERRARCGGSDSCRLGSEPGVSGESAARVSGTLGAPPVREVGGEASSWILLTSTPRQGMWNLAACDGIEFWYRGPGTGGRVWIEVICQERPGPHADDTGIRFVAYEPDTVAGWRLIRLPWSAFALRAGQAPGSILHTSRVLMINIAQLCEQHPDFAVDRIAAWTAVPAAARPAP